MTTDSRDRTYEFHWDGGRTETLRGADGLISSTSVHNPNDGPEDARSLAAALLAAAKAVEGQ